MTNRFAFAGLIVQFSTVQNYTTDGPCLDAVQIVLDCLCQKNVIGQRDTHGLILFAKQSY